MTPDLSCACCHDARAVRTVNGQRVCLWCPDTTRPDDLNRYGEKRTAPRNGKADLFGKMTTL